MEYLLGTGGSWRPDDANASSPRGVSDFNILSFSTEFPMASGLFNCGPKSVATLLLIVVIAGCGPKAPFPLAPVHGTVSYQGKPVTQGRVA